MPKPQYRSLPGERIQYSASFDVDSETHRYFVACARIRKISPQTLLRRLMKAIAEDQLVGGILDDDGKPAPVQRGEKYCRDSSAGVFDGL